MARQIVVAQGETCSAFGLEKVDRAKLYGARKRVPLDPSGGACTKAALTADGGLLLRPGMSAQGYFDAAGYWYAQGDLVPLSDDGAEVPVHPSTLGVPQPLRPTTPEEVLDLRISTVYALEPEDVAPALAEALAAGALFAFDFSYRGGPRLETGVLLANPTGIYALVGEPAPPEWCALSQAAVPAPDAAGDDLDDDLDFEMF